MRTTCQANQFAMSSSTFLQPSHEISTFAGQLVQMNSTILRQFNYSHYDGMDACISWHYSSGDVHSFCYYKAFFCFVWCSHFQVVISTDTCCMFCGCRSSHLPWLQHKLANDTALAMLRTEQILCLSFILNFGCKLFPCIICPAAQGIFQGPVGFFRALCYQLDNIAFLRLWGSESNVPTVPASSIRTCFNWI